MKITRQAATVCLVILATVASYPRGVAAQPSCGPGSIVHADGTCTQIVQPQMTSPGPKTYAVPANREPVLVENPLGVSSICGLIKAILGAVIQIGIPVAVLF